MSRIWGVYPLIPVEPTGSYTYKAAYAPVSSGEQLRVERRVSGEFRLEGHLSKNEWSIERPLSLSLGDGVFVRRVREFKRLIGRPTHFLGVVEDLFTNEEREVYVIDFNPHCDAGDMNRFRAARWFKDNTAKKGFF